MAFLVREYGNQTQGSKGVSCVDVWDRPKRIKVQSPQEQKEDSQTFVDLILDSNCLSEYSSMDSDIIYTRFVSCFVLFLIDTIFHNMGSLGRRRKNKTKDHLQPLCPLERLEPK